MHIIRKVSSLEVKRCFVLSQRFTSKKMRKKQIIDIRRGVDSVHFMRDLFAEKRSVFALSERSLDRIISTENNVRCRLYTELNWYIAEVDTRDICMWPCAAGLYRSWTERVTLCDTARRMTNEYKKVQSRLRDMRAYKTIPEIINFTSFLFGRRYLLPIAVPTGAHNRHRAGIRTIPLFLDDGNLRSLTFAIKGKKKIPMYVGIVK